LENKIALYGNGGHSKVLQDCAATSGTSISIVFDDVDHPYNIDENPHDKIVIAIGNNEVRERIAGIVEHEFGILIHRSAQIAADVLIGDGTVVLANAVIQAGAEIGRHVIVNANCVIDHDAVIEDFVSIYPGAYVGGNARVGKGKTVGPNEVVERGMCV